MLSQNDILYFILVDRFFDGDPSNNTDVDKSNPLAYHGGDFAGIIQKIPYLKHIGVTALWISPAYENIHLPESKSFGYHGYWPLHYDKVDPHLYSENSKYPLGSRLYLKDLVDELHANGIKLILDMVVNHTGYNHPALKNDLSTPLRLDWFNPESIQSDEEGRMWGLPDLDQDNVDVRDYFLQNTLEWIEQTGIDGIRMDTVKHVERSFWYHYKTMLKGKFDHLSLLGEVLDNDVSRLADFQKYFAFDHLFDFPLQKAITDVFIKGAGMKAICSPDFTGEKGILDYDPQYTNHNKLVTLLDNHDLPRRFMTEAIEQFGTKSNAVSAYKMALTFLFTVRGIPQIYYGTEFGLEGAGDPDNRRDMPWEIFNQDYEVWKAFSSERQIFEHFRKLSAIRQETDALCFGSFATLYVDHFILVFLREFRESIAIVAFNNGKDPMPHDLLVEIDRNTKLPSRIKEKLRNSRLANVLQFGDAIKTTAEHIPLRLLGQSAKIYVPMPE